MVQETTQLSAQAPLVKQVYESNPDTNALTDALKALIQTAVQSVNGKTGNTIVITLDDIGNGAINVAFTATMKTKLDGIAAGATVNSTDAYLRARTNHTGTQTADTISDFDVAADLRISAKVGMPNGLAPLGADSLIPAQYLPSYVDDVLEYDDFADFPATGETGKIYLAKDTGKTYRWGGSVYVEISPSDVNSVNGHTGVVTLTTADFAEVGNLWFTDERAQDAVGGILTNSASINLTYNDGAGQISAALNLNNANVWTAHQSVPDDAYGAGWNGSVQVPTKNAVYDKMELVNTEAHKEVIVVACSDETTAITTGTDKVKFRMPFAMTLTAVRASVGTAPTGANLVIDINESGATILSTKLSIDATEKTSTTAATAAVISDASLADDAEITIDFDQVGSTIAGAGVKVELIGTRQ